jgi:tRNA (guanine37-N1)-methyltransferase
MGERPLVKVLKDKLTKEELDLVPRSYDLIGSKEKEVAVIEIPEEIQHKNKEIAEAVIKLNKNVKSVLNKMSGRKGPYRLEDLEVIFGDTNTEVTHREYGCMIKLDPQKVFFSPRELTERQRIASEVKAGETVLIMFSGSMPYGIIIAKRQPLVKKIYGIEINPVAYRYALENVRKNKLSHKFSLINDDVRKICPTLEKVDRIAMPYAIGAYQYLDEAFKCIKPGGTIHFYHISPEIDMYTEAESFVRSTASDFGRKIHIFNRVKVLPFGTRYWKICLDVKVLD